MDFERDYFMRQIKNMTKAIVNLFFDDNTPAVKLHEDDLTISSEGLLYLQLKYMVSQKQINEAENILFEEISDKITVNLLYVALQFYNDLQDLSDEYLVECNFTREEIIEGLEEINRIYHEQPYQ